MEPTKTIHYKTHNYEKKSFTLHDVSLRLGRRGKSTNPNDVHRMNADGTELVPATGLIEPFEAVFVVATFNNENVVIAPEE